MHGSVGVLTDGQAAAIAGVVVAAFGLIGAIVTALITRPAKAAAKDAAEKVGVVARAVGTPNGKGNVVQMSEKQLELLTRIAVDLADLSVNKTNEHNALRGDMQAGLAGVSTKLGDVVDAMDHHGARIERIEQHLALPPLPRDKEPS